MGGGGCRPSCAQTGRRGHPVATASAPPPGAPLKRATMAGAASGGRYTSTHSASTSVGSAGRQPASASTASSADTSRRSLRAVGTGGRRDGAALERRGGRTFRQRAVQRRVAPIAAPANDLLVDGPTAVAGDPAWQRPPACVEAGAERDHLRRRARGRARVQKLLHAEPIAASRANVPRLIMAPGERARTGRYRRRSAAPAGEAPRVRRREAARAPRTTCARRSRCRRRGGLRAATPSQTRCVANLAQLCELLRATAT